LTSSIVISYNINKLTYLLTYLLEEHVTFDLAARQMIFIRHFVEVTLPSVLKTVCDDSFISYGAFSAWNLWLLRSRSQNDTAVAENRTTDGQTEGHW